ncbi:MAG: hypothetical protein ACJ745_12485 [Actinomycetes bacterium]
MQQAEQQRRPEPDTDFADAAAQCRDEDSAAEGLLGDGDAQGADRQPQDQRAFLAAPVRPHERHDDAKTEQRRDQQRPSR